MASHKNTRYGWGSPPIPQRDWEDRGWKSLYQPPVEDPLEASVTDLDPLAACSRFIWWLARHTTRDEFVAQTEAFWILLGAFVDNRPPPAMALDAKLQRGLDRMFNNPDFDQPIKLQRDLERFARTLFNQPAHAGGAPAGGGDLGMAVQRIKEYADNNPSWRTLKAPAMARELGLKPDIDISARTMRAALKKVRDESSR